MGLFILPTWRARDIFMLNMHIPNIEHRMPLIGLACRLSSAMQWGESSTWRDQVSHNYTECIYCSISIGRSTVRHDLECKRLSFSVRACHGVAVASWYIHATVVALPSLASGDRKMEHSTVSPVGIRALLLLLLLLLLID